MADLINYFLFFTYLSNIILLYILKYTFHNEEYRKIILNALKNKNNLEEIGTVVEYVLLFQVYTFAGLIIYTTYYK